jgi:hypothetical protein
VSIDSQYRNIMGEKWEDVKVILPANRVAFIARARRIADNVWFMGQSDTPEGAFNKLKRWEVAPEKPPDMSIQDYIHSAPYLSVSALLNGRQ